ncbi:hypothetical protein SAMN03159338_1550 [Sphingomonas sp. NFR04]|uniref:hypothetical protein n=1 Tax=Sphingomonas sp. NFR04 TaxID=1566283 RepID=UPI0008EC8F41|nr:hypothetical protein [Sphingomonas sp. NFR04]SFJ49203.1 hypothetical protein SAMN03159338_1550 [Sphingomonas sp. NFR04]
MKFKHSAGELSLTAVALLGDQNIVKREGALLAWDLGEGSEEDKVERLAELDDKVVAEIVGREDVNELAGLKMLRTDIASARYELARASAAVEPVAGSQPTGTDDAVISVATTQSSVEHEEIDDEPQAQPQQQPQARRRRG